MLRIARSCILYDSTESAVLKKNGSKQHVNILTSKPNWIKISAQQTDSLPQHKPHQPIRAPNRFRADRKSRKRATGKCLAYSKERTKGCPRTKSFWSWRKLLWRGSKLRFPQKIYRQIISKAAVETIEQKFDIAPQAVAQRVEWAKSTILIGSLTTKKGLMKQKQNASSKWS